MSFPHRLSKRNSDGNRQTESLLDIRDFVTLLRDFSPKCNESL